MVPIIIFQPLCDGVFPDPSEWFIPHRVRDGLTIRRGQRHLIYDGINLATSTCHSRFRLQLYKESVMLQKIGVGCYSRGYNSSTCNSVEIGGVIADKLASLFHILSKSHTVHLNKKTFSRGKILGFDKFYKSQCFNNSLHNWYNSYYYDIFC